MRTFECASNEMDGKYGLYFLKESNNPLTVTIICGSDGRHGQVTMQEKTAPTREDMEALLGMLYTLASQHKEREESDQAEFRRSQVKKGLGKSLLPKRIRK